MSEEAKGQEGLRELAVLAHRLSDDVKVGPKQLKIFPLDVTDLTDLEEKIGSLARLSQLTKLSDLLFIIWLGVRKTGIGGDDIVNQKWPFTARELGACFGLNQGDEMMALVCRIFLKSGIQFEQMPGPAVDALKKTLREEGLLPSEVESSGDGSGTPSQPSAASIPGTSEA